MQLEIAGTQDATTALDLREQSVDRAALVAAIRDDPSPYTVECPQPGPVHDRAGVLVPEMGLETKTALAAAARSRGIETDHDDRIERLADDLAALTASIEDDHSPASGPPPGDVARLRERTAELRGQVSALEAADADPTDARARLRETAARLSELETRRIAAEQTRERTRELRDRRERRLRLEDRLANARRDARAALVEAVRVEYAAAVDAVSVADPADPFDAPPPSAALAVLRVADVRAPVVLDVALPDAAEWVTTPDTLASWLDAPVLRL